MMYMQDEGPMKAEEANDPANGHRLDEVLAELREVRARIRDMSERARVLDEQAHKLLKALHIQVEQRNAPE